jgi:hypothetical protein
MAATAEPPVASMGSRTRKVADAFGAGDLEIVVVGAEGFLVAIETDVTHPGRGNQRGDAVHHAKPGAENGHQGQLAAGDLAAGRDFQRSLHLDRVGREIAGDFVGHQGGDLGDQLLEVPGAGLPVPEQGHLVKNEGMVNDGEVGEGRGRHGQEYAAVPGAGANSSDEKRVTSSGDE